MKKKFIAWETMIMSIPGLCIFHMPAKTSSDKKTIASTQRIMEIIQHTNTCLGSSLKIAKLIFLILLFLSVKEVCLLSCTGCFVCLPVGKKHLSEASVMIIHRGWHNVNYILHISFVNCFLLIKKACGITPQARYIRCFKTFCISLLQTSLRPLLSSPSWLYAPKATA